jgi:hypothetical protein
MVTAYFSTMLSKGISSSLTMLTGEIKQARFLPFDCIGSGTLSSGEGILSDSYSVLMYGINVGSFLRLLQEKNI